MSTSKYHHGDLSRALVAAAGALLRREGLGGLSLRAVAREAGVSPAAPYRHFADKDALLAALAASGFASLRTALETADAAEASPRAALTAQGAAYVAFATAEPELFRLMFGGAKPADAAGLYAEAGATFEVLRHRIATLLPPAEVETGALGAWSMVHGLASLIVDRRIEAADPAALAHEVLRRFDAGAQLR